MFYFERFMKMFSCGPSFEEKFPLPKNASSKFGWKWQTGSKKKKIENAFLQIFIDLSLE